MKSTILAVFSCVLPMMLATFPAQAQITSERPVSTPVYAPATGFYSAAIASNGDGFLAAWQQGEGLHVARIDRDGTVLDPLGLLVASPPYAGVGVAWDGEAYVVVWTAYDGIVAARIASDGRVADGPRTVVHQGASLNGSQSIAANGNVTVITTGSSYYVLDHSLRQIIFGSVPHASVFRTGADGFTLISSTEVQGLGSSGRSFLNVASAGFYGDSISCHGQDCIRISSNQATKHLTVAPFDPTSLKSGTPLDLPMTEGPFKLTVTASGYLVATNDGAVQRLDMRGNPSSPSSCCQPAGLITAASNGHDAVVLRQSFNALTFTMMGPQTDGQPRNLALTANAQRSPAIAGSGSNYLVAWAEDDGAYAGRLSPDGAILDGRGFLISRTIPLPNWKQSTPPLSVVFYDSTYFVTTSTIFDPWSGKRDALATIARIDPATGAILASSAICGSDMRMATNGTSVVALWVDCAGSLEAAFIDVRATLSIPVILAKPQASVWSTYFFLANPNLAWNGTEWLVTWEEQETGCAPCPNFSFWDMGLKSVRLSAELTPKDTRPIAIGDRGAPYSSRLASDGHDFLAVWIDYWLHTQRASASGSLLEERKLGYGNPQDLVWDGSAYSMAYRTYDRNLGVLKLSPSGQPLDSFVISATPDDERSAALLPLGSGRVLAAYTRVAHEPLYAGVERVFVAAPRPARGRAAQTGN